MDIAGLSYSELLKIAPAIKKLAELEEAKSYEQDLYKFMQAAWKYIDPAEFVGGWHLQAIAEHLQAVTRGDIKRLIINVPPRTSKSSLCSVAWPAWTWAQSQIGPCSGPQVQFLSASYAHTLSLRDSVKTRRVIESGWYKKHWGNRYAMTGDVNTKGRFENDKGGFRLATSVDGTNTGEGGQCFVSGTRISVPGGHKNIENLRIGDCVFAFDHLMERVVISPISAIKSRWTPEIYEVHTTARHSFRCTGNHPVYVPGRGYIIASELGIGDRLLRENKGWCLRAKAPNCLFSSMRRMWQVCHQTAFRGSQGLKAKKCGCLLFGSVQKIAFFLQALKKMFGLRRIYEKGGFCRKILFRSLQDRSAPAPQKTKDMSALRGVFSQSLQYLLQFGMCRYGAFPTYAWESQFKIQRTWEIFQSIQTDIGTDSRARWPQMRGLWSTGQTCSDWKGRSPQAIQTPSASYRREHQEQFTREFDPLVHKLSQEESSWDFDSITSIIIHRDGKYLVHDIEVGEQHNFFAEGILAHNCILVDDPHSAGEVESDIVRVNTLQWWDEVMGSRLNDPATGAYVVIMQRLHQEDLTGHIITKEQDSWTWIMLPMHYDPNRHCQTFVNGHKFWEDPRTEDNELLCKDRFSEESVQALARRLGPFACNPYEAPILMADLTMRPIGEVKVGDCIVGFDKKKRGDSKNGRYKLEKSKVLAVHSRVAPVVKITLDSGEVIRCTPDHKWYTKDRGGRRAMYSKATLRSKLARICPPKLPTLTTTEERLAGWLSGFFDGEGTVSMCQPTIPGNYRASASISFYQGAGRNLPLCEKLEMALRHFGFEFSYVEDERKTKKDAACYGYRAYRLKGIGLPLYQRFLHIVQPTKWRNRMIEGAYKCNFIKGRERVVSIEPDGEDVVYALTTTTGNYVVWGLASSNSAGQLEQSPVPRGGGIIKEEWWQLWTQPTYPRCEYILASLDTAYTEKEENDASALTIWGIFKDENNNPRIMLLYGWQDRLAINDLVIKVGDTCTVDKRSVLVKHRFPVDKLIIESKASGISVAQELHRLHGLSGKFGVELYNPTKLGDKIARVYSIQHIFADGLVYVPFPSDPGAENHYKWSSEIIDQITVFPRGSHDDFCFVAGTKIAARHGDIPVEDIKIGDEVLTPVGWRKVINCGMTGIKSVITRRGLTGTGNHPIFTVDRGYVALKDVDESHTLSRLTSVDTGEVSEKNRIRTMQPVFNLEVEGAHCYYANGILVHNCDSMSMAIRYLRDTGFALNREEHSMAVFNEMAYRPRVQPLYPV